MFILSDPNYISRFVLARACLNREQKAKCRIEEILLLCLSLTEKKYNFEIISMLVIYYTA